LTNSAANKPVTILAQPGPLQIDLSRTALIIVDMQNAFASPGGMFDLLGMDISGAPLVIKQLQRLSPPLRAAGVKIVYLTMGYQPDLSDSGGPESPNWHKESGVAEFRKRPEHGDKFLIRGTWGERIVDELTPQPGDIVIPKTRFSGFWATKLDEVLKSHHIKFLLFAGIATNVCVESTLRDAFFRDYWPILLTDCTHNVGPAITQQAAIWNVLAVFGWVAGISDVLKAIEELKAAAHGAT